MSLAERFDVLQKTYDRVKNFSEVRQAMFLLLIVIFICYGVFLRRVTKKKYWDFYHI